MAYDIQKVISIALAEVGYKEKETNAQLDDKTANAGDGNFTKYAKHLDSINFYNGRKNGHAWCDVFFDYCMERAYGKAAALKITFQPTNHARNCGAGCEYSKQYYVAKGRYFHTPQVGDQIFFKGSNGKAGHTGIVYKYSTTKVYTVEGNTSSASGVVDNGGEVCRKSYSLKNSRIDGYGRPDYGEQSTPAASATKPTTGNALGARTLQRTTPIMSGADVKELQTRLNALGYDCGTIDGKFGHATEKGVKAFQKAAGLTVDGVFGVKSFAALEAAAAVDAPKQAAPVAEKARKRDKTLSGNYTAAGDVNIRAGAGTDKDVLTTVPKGGRVRCYGYYTPVNGTKWLYVMYKGVSGFCSINNLNNG